MTSSLRGFIFWKKRPPFFKAWFACDQLPPGVYFLEKRHLTFLEAWFSCDKRPPGVYFLKKRPPKSSQSCPRLAKQLPRASDPAEAIARSFFHFLRDVSNGMIGFESILGSDSAENGRKSICFARGIPQKVKKSSNESEVLLFFADRCTKYARF